MEIGSGVNSQASTGNERGIKSISNRAVIPNADDAKLTFKSGLLLIPGTMVESHICSYNLYQSFQLRGRNPSFLDRCNINDAL